MGGRSSSYGRKSDLGSVSEDAPGVWFHLGRLLKCPAGGGGLASGMASLAGRKAVQKALECGVTGDDAHLLGDVWCGDGACCLVA